MAMLMEVANGYNNACELIIPPRSCSDCVEKESGKVRAVGYVKTGRTFFDPTNVLEWLQAIYDGDAVIVHNINGTYNGGEATTSEGYGYVSLRLDSRTHVLTYTEIYNCANRDFYNAIADAQDFRVFLALDKSLRESSEPASIIATAPVNAIETTNEFSVTVTWSERNLMDCHALPGTLFKSCADFNRLWASFCPACNSGTTGTLVCPVDCTVPAFGTFV